MRDLDARPVYVALVDTCCSEDFLELVKGALLAALEALPPVALFGLVTFSDKVGPASLGFPGRDVKIFCTGS